MRILVLHAHPDPESFNGALCRATVEALSGRGHEIDLCDLYAEDFDPILRLDERRAYHEPARNRAGVEAYVDRLEAAEGLVLVYPVWNFGFPAMLKGFLDRVFLPGVSFVIDRGRAAPNLQRVRFLAAVTTYGAPRWRALMLGDPPRRVVTRVMRVLVAPNATSRYLALYDMNRRTAPERGRFLDEVRTAMSAV